MDYLITLITPFPRSHQATNIIKGLFLCRNIFYPEWKRLWVSSLSSILVPKFGLTFLKNWNLFCHICLENNVKTSCCLTKIRVEFRFICLSLFRKIVLMSLFSLMFSPLQLLTPPTVDKHAFLTLFFIVVCLLILSDIDSLHFVTFLLILVKRLQLKIDVC